MTTKFSNKFKTKTDSELLEIVETPGSYQKEAVLTAIYELESREISNDVNTNSKSKIQSQIELGNQNIKSTIRNESLLDLPSTISNSSKIIYLSAALGIINPILVNLLTHINNFSNPINLLIILTSSGTLAFFGFQINLGKKWSRDVFTILFGLGLLAFPFVITDTFRLNPIIGILSLLQAVLQGYAVLLLFKSSSRSWYKKQKLNKKTTPQQRTEVKTN
ncbi:hypothetical protein SAMN04489761_0395 [Tenacibaculum sp. MAR_2009_124]|uniref:hypothetical protein n=1 Tax=Tenacibaculum sp. MAR_2009_124 TaxID=1250059 RepID=UPI0008977538|nr:hypothetical protein [Tenacibaculum sp. MAR_2009_124]SEB39205.1 hypothetical protein SAMN04489761_0395 [Tenacibaculum sp. MAR_2009_124]